MYLLRLQLPEPQNCLDELGIAFALVRNRRLKGLELSVALNQLLRSSTIGVIIGSAVFVSPALVMSLAPAGIPEAVEKGWFFVIDPADCSPRMLRLMPFLSPHPCFRKGWCRHLALGLWLSILYIPIPILLVRFVVSTDGV